jgi:hypothetical protein
LSPTSVDAAKHAYNFGGQISAQLRKALVKAKYQSASVVECLHFLENATPIVYAVNLETLLKGGITNDSGSKNIYVGEKIAPELLIARINMPREKPSILDDVIPDSPTFKKLRSMEGTLVNILFKKSLAGQAFNTYEEDSIV